MGSNFRVQFRKGIRIVDVHGVFILHWHSFCKRGRRNIDPEIASGICLLHRFTWIPKALVKIPCAMKETCCFLERKAALKEQCWQLVFPCWELLVLVIVLVTHLQRRTT